MSVEIIEVPFQADLLQQTDNFIDERFCSRELFFAMACPKFNVSRHQNTCFKDY